MTGHVRIHVEGGGDRRGKKAIRLAVGEFLRELRDMAREKRIRWTVVACGPRGQALDTFRRAVRQNAGAFNVLLVDSEGPVSATPWEHLAEHDGWKRPAGAEDQHCHLMVQIMEAWFVADPEALEGFYGRGFRRGRLPSRQEVEEIGKREIVDSLKRAARETAKGGYHKGRHAPELLSLVDPDKIRMRAPHCNRLFETLAAAIGKGGPQ